MATTASGLHSVRAGRMKGILTLGGVAIKDPVVGIEGNVGVIGMDFLQYFILTFDQKKMSVWIQSANDDPIPTPSSYYTGYGTLSLGGAREVIYVIPNSPASLADIKVKDLIVSINSKPVAEYDYPSLNALFSKPGKVHLTIHRGNKILEKEVSVKVIVE